MIYAVYFWLPLLSLCFSAVCLWRSGSHWQNLSFYTGIRGATTPCLLDLPTGFCLRFPAVSASALFIYSIKKISSELLSGYVLLSFYEFSEDVVPPLFTFTLSHNISTHCHNHNGTNNSHFGFLRNRSSTTVLSTPLSAVIP